LNGIVSLILTLMHDLHSVKMAVLQCGIAAHTHTHMHLWPMMTLSLPHRIGERWVWPRSTYTLRNKGPF